MPLPKQNLTRRGFLQQSNLVALAAVALERDVWSQQDVPTKLTVHSLMPLNAETPLDQLVRSWVTPNDQFYIRSHAPAPQIDVGDFQLSVEGMVRRPLKISLAELKRNFGSHTVFATLTCAGNRRSEHSQVKEVSGVQWQSGAIGNARWKGPRISDLLRKAGVMKGARHVWFEGMDEIPRNGKTISFGASIPLAKAMGDTATMPGALLAYEMNDMPLSPDHGFPLRTVVPGFIGARSVKWLGRIVVSDRPSENHYVANAYKLVTEGEAAQWQAASPLNEFVMNSVTCVPGSGSRLPAGEVEVRGFALPPGTGGLLRQIEVSSDGGVHWTTAQVHSPQVAYCWQLWTAKLSVAAGSRQLLVRATDSSGARQPEQVEWNLKGYMFNGWHKTDIQVRS